jgi:hypothetical protein
MAFYKILVVGELERNGNGQTRRQKQVESKLFFALSIHETGITLDDLCKKKTGLMGGCPFVSASDPLAGGGFYTEGHRTVDSLLCTTATSIYGTEIILNRSCGTNLRSYI